MKRDHKKNLLQNISRNLELFYPDLKGLFICPTCLKRISLNDMHLISEAHIVPKSAGGRLTTFLCRECNSLFGSNQDKWFGDVIDTEFLSRKSILYTSYKRSFFYIDGLKVNGRWEISSKNEFRFIICPNRNSPDVNDIVKKKFSRQIPNINVKIPFPILEKKELVNVGLLTAGYLMWFSVMGYSWVFQNHLNCVREQIVSPNKNIINNYAFTVNSNHELWYGFSHIGKEYAPAFGINDLMVVYPPSDLPDLYKTLETNYQDTSLFKFHRFDTTKKKVVPPTILMYDNRVLIAPDTLENAKDTLTIIIYSRDNPNGSFFTPISKEEFERNKNFNDTVIIELTTNMNKFHKQ